MNCCYLNLPSYPMSSFVDPGVWFHEINHNCSVIDLNISFWNSFFCEYKKDKRLFSFINPGEDFNFQDIDIYEHFFEEMNVKYSKWSFSLSRAILYYKEEIVLKDIETLVFDLPMEIQTVLINEISKLSLIEYEVIVFSIHSIFEVFCMYFLMKNIARQKKEIIFCIGTAKFENFYIDRHKLQSYLGLFYNISDINTLKLRYKNTAYNGRYEIRKDSPITLNIFEEKCYWQRCHFCFQSKIKDNDILQIQTDEKILQKLLFYVNLGLTRFIFQDECFTIEKLNYFSDLLINNNIKISWVVRLRFRNDYNKELIKKLKQAGLVQILFGIESASNRILSIIDKYDFRFKEKDFIKLAHELKRNNIYIHLCFITGFPFEKKRDIKRNIHFINMLIRHRIYFTSFINIFQYYQFANIEKDISDFITNPYQITSDFNIPIHYTYNSKSYWYKKNPESFYLGMSQMIKKSFYNELLLNKDMYFEMVNRTAFGFFTVREKSSKYIKNKFLKK